MQPPLPQPPPNRLLIHIVIDLLSSGPWGRCRPSCPALIPVYVIPAEAVTRFWEKRERAAPDEKGGIARPSGVYPGSQQSMICGKGGVGYAFSGRRKRPVAYGGGAAYHSPRTGRTTRFLFPGYAGKVPAVCYPHDSARKPVRRARESGRGEFLLLERSMKVK